MSRRCGGLGSSKSRPSPSAGRSWPSARPTQLSIPKAYGDYQAAAGRPGDSGRAQLHAESSALRDQQGILAAGSTSSREKPLAMNSTESRELVRLAKEAGVVNAINFNYRYMPLVQQAHQMCQAAGDVGRIYAVHGSYLQDWLLMENDWNWRLVPELSGDSRAVADVGSHWCDLVQFITGLKIVRVMADLVTIHPDAQAAEGRSRNVRRQSAAAGGPGRRADQHRGLRLDPARVRLRRARRADREPMRGRAQEPAVLRNRRQQVRARRGTRSGRTSCGSAAATDRTRR